MAGALALFSHRRVLNSEKLCQNGKRVKGREIRPNRTGPAFSLSEDIPSLRARERGWLTGSV